MKAEALNSGFFAQAANLPDQIAEALNAKLPPLEKADRICICGVGNSALAADVMKDFADGTSMVPLYVVRDIDLPGWVDQKTTVILLSYSGATKEVLMSYEKAREHGCRCIVITSGGELARRAFAFHDATILMKPGLISRDALGYLLGHLASVLEKMEVCNAATELRRLVPILMAQRDRLLSPDSDIVDSIAKMLLDRIPVIYSLSDMRAAAIRWKTQINENTESVSFCGALPEFNHNEIVGWADDRNNKFFVPVILYDDDASDMVRSMTDASISILEEKKIELVAYHISGTGNMDRNLNCILLGDFVSYYLAYLYSTGAKRATSKTGRKKLIFMECTT